MITNIPVQYNANFIATVLWKREVAKVSSITLIPQILNAQISHIAYIDIDSFCETEAAYQFIRDLKDGPFRFYHSPQDFWLMQKNTHNSGNLSVGPYTTLYMADFFEYESTITFAEHITHADNQDDDDDQYYECDDDEWQQFDKTHPIKGLDNVYYTIEQALQKIIDLNQMIDEESAFTHRVHLEQELAHFEQQLALLPEQQVIPIAHSLREISLDMPTTNTRQTTVGYHLNHHDDDHIDFASHCNDWFLNSKPIN